MTDDLDDRLRDLVSVAGGQGRLPSATELRRRGDRRRRGRQIAVAALVLVVISGGYTVGTSPFDQGGGPAGPPTVSIAPSPSPTVMSESDEVKQQKKAAAETKSIRP
jgi:hypothetical protein